MTYMKSIEKIAQRYQRNNRRHQNDKQANDEGMGRRKERKKNFAFDCDTARAKLHSFDGIFDLEQPALRTPSRRIVIVLITKHFFKKKYFL